MRLQHFPVLSFILTRAWAAREFLNEPDTDIDYALGDIVANGTLPPLSSIVGLPDFDWVARHHLNHTAYTYYRAGAAGEFSYRNNLEAFHRVRFRPRILVDITNIVSTLPTTILGYNFSAPFFISPCGNAGYGHPNAEINLVQGAHAGEILYMVSDFSTASKDAIRDARAPDQIMFQQMYTVPNKEDVKKQVQRAENDGFKAILLTVDSAGDGNRQRAARYGVGSADTDYTFFTWDYWQEIQSWTQLPVVPKGIMRVEDAVKAVELGAKAIYLSNHGGRQLDGVPAPLEIALEISEKAPWVFEKTEVFADGGVRYGADVLKMLALGVKAVGMGRPFMYANVFGVDGVKHAIDLMKREIAIDSANLGVGDLKKIDTSFVDYRPNGWFM
ncbi:FMN-dependent alpha-hydroxy acid dehydrogenase [Marasmius fiardii PR-910]|nr:FMN-dependent alpha-hydroxy acid dehydrogenase [Marasmius fiardii PR-910]